jgi:hypothetical protein
MHCKRVFQLVVLLAGVLTLSVSSFGQSQKDGPLTNADLERMVKAGISENTILRVIQVSETNFATNPNALIELKHHHVSDRIIDALLDTRSGTIPNPSESQPSNSIAVEPRMSGTHQLPNFDAAVRLNAKTTAKVAVRQNHIKVERSGVPLFSLSWKEKDSH